MSAVYYNENNEHTAQWLTNLTRAGLLPQGVVDHRDIRSVQPHDLMGYAQCHFFAGIGGWPVAAQLAGWPSDLPIWSGSCPCQPWSKAGEGTGRHDARHLWPEWFRLIRACRPPFVVGEQVADAVGRGWVDEVAGCLEGVGYAFRAVVIPACSSGAFHRRDRVFFVADSGGQGLSRAQQSTRSIQAKQASDVRPSTAERDRRPPWWDYRQQRGQDGISRMVQPGVSLLTHGISARVAVIGALGNAIVPQLAAEVLSAYLDCLS
jgi:DNA (cytosine-5)-methyltransferase 1